MPSRGEGDFPGPAGPDTDQYTRAHHWLTGRHEHLLTCCQDVPPGPERPQGHRLRVELRAGAAERLTGIPFPWPEPTSSPSASSPPARQVSPRQRHRASAITSAASPPGPGPGPCPASMAAVTRKCARRRRAQCACAQPPLPQGGRAAAGRAGLGAAALPAAGTASPSC